MRVNVCAPAYFARTRNPTNVSAEHSRVTHDCEKPRKTKSRSSSTPNRVIIIIIVAATLNFRVGILLRLQAKRVLSSAKHNYNSMENRVLFPRRGRKSYENNNLWKKIARTAQKPYRRKNIRKTYAERRKSRKSISTSDHVGQVIKYPISFIPLNKSHHLSWFPFLGIFIAKTFPLFRLRLQL